MSEPEDFAEEISAVEKIVKEISPLLAGRQPEVVAGVLADLMATLLASHVLHDDNGVIDRGETDKMREALMHEHIRAIYALIPLNEAEIFERLK